MAYDGFRISSDADDVQLDAVHAFLTTSYWAGGISRALVAQAIQGSIPFSLLHEHAQVGFARVVTDRATFAYVADVYVLEQYRGRGLARWLMETVVAYPELAGIRRLMLVTRDAQPLYAQVGFTPLAHPERHMELVRQGLYAKSNS